MRAMADPVRFRGVVEPFKAGASGGLMTVAFPPADVTAIGGLKQMKVRGLINGQAFESNTMPRGGGTLALSVSKAMLKVAGAAPGDEVDLEVERR